jgi:hypothetical protein
LGKGEAPSAFRRWWGFDFLAAIVTIGGFHELHGLSVPAAASPASSSLFYELTAVGGVSMYQSVLPLNLWCSYRLPEELVRIIMRFFAAIGKGGTEITDL